MKKEQSICFLFTVDDLECSGGSPLEAGIIMCLSGIWSGTFVRTM